MINKNRKVQVCDKCLTACCWHGELMCDESKTAGTTLLTVEALREMKLEHRHHYSKKNIRKIYGGDPCYDESD